MKKIDVIKEEILFVKGKTDQLIAGWKPEQWCLSPEVLQTNLNWQIGHIILAK